MYVRDELAVLCAEAEVPVISPYEARHTAATLALGATGNRPEDARSRANLPDGQSLRPRNR